MKWHFFTGGNPLPPAPPPFLFRCYGKTLHNYFMPLTFCVFSETMFEMSHNYKIFRYKLLYQTVKILD